MAPLTTLLRDVYGMQQDSGRDHLPDGAMWNLVDWIPAPGASGLRMRGGYKAQNTNQFGANVDAVIYAPFAAGDVLLSAAGNNVQRIPLPTPGASSFAFSIAAVKQNPFMHRDRLIFPAASGAIAAVVATYNGSAFSSPSLPASALQGRYGVAWKDRVVLANSSAQPTQVAFSKPGDPTVAWDALSLVNTNQPITGLAAMRNQILVFHSTSVDRIRGTVPPDSTLTDPTGDLILDVLHDRAGCFDARSIVNWQDNVLFADARGVWLTDGSSVRNMAAQGGWLSYWQAQFNQAVTVGTVTSVGVGGGLYQDYYLLTITGPNFTPITFVIHIPTRRMFTFSGIEARAYTSSVGTTEKLYAGTATFASGLQRVIDLTPCFVLDPNVAQSDPSGVSVTPLLESPWYRLSKGTQPKRVRDLHFSYYANVAGTSDQFAVTIGATPNGDFTDVATTGALKAQTVTKRRKIAINRPMEGFFFRLQGQGAAMKDARLYDVSVWAYGDEPTKLEI